MKKIITFISSAGAEAVRILFETAPEKQTGRRRPVKRILERDAILHQIEQSELLFFERHPAALPLYEAFSKKLFERFPSTDKKVQKSQITFSNRYLYVCVSFFAGKKEGGTSEILFCRHPWVALSARLPSGGRQNGALSREMDDPSGSLLRVGAGRRALPVDRAGL